MQIAYLNKGKAKMKSQVDEMMELAYLRDMRRSWNKSKVELQKLGLTQESFIASIKEKLREKKGLFLV